MTTKLKLFLRSIWIPLITVPSFSLQTKVQTPSSNFNNSQNNPMRSMMNWQRIIFALISIHISNTFAQSETTSVNQTNLPSLCEQSLKRFPGPTDQTLLQRSCAQVQQLPGCVSVQGTPLFHFDKKSILTQAKRVLVLSLIHGDETEAGTVGRYWMERLEDVDPRNTWRVVPVLNPDGVLAKTRTNFRNIDLNRNFPTRDWTELAHNYWTQQTKKNPRRFPGDTGGSEPEVQCVLQHLQDFKPDFVVSIHTPLNVLDFDGPKVKPPPYDYLPWKSLGHFPGSLGRYLWFERETPVLTMELKNQLPKTLATFEKLQDVIGSLVKYEIRTQPKVNTSSITLQIESEKNDN